MYLYNSGLRNKVIQGSHHMVGKVYHSSLVYDKICYRHWKYGTTLLLKKIKNKKGKAKVF